MRIGKLALGAMAVCALGCAGVRRRSLTPIHTDPYLWLDRHPRRQASRLGRRPRMKRPSRRCAADPQYQQDYDAILKVLDANDRIPQGELDHGDVFNFWQDADHARGIWRRVDGRRLSQCRTRPGRCCSTSTSWTPTSTRTGSGRARIARRASKPAWCGFRRAAATLRSMREFDPQSRQVRGDGFSLSVAKSSATYVDKDTVLFATDFGPGTMTAVELSAHRETLASRRAGQRRQDGVRGKVSDISAAARGVSRTLWRDRR